MAMNFEERLQATTAQIEKILERYLPKEEGYQRIVLEAMNYSVRAGGKRLRPMLMWEVYDMFGGHRATVEPFMAAIEMIHTYSLVHDDLPAMDNDDYRRGKLTTHKAYGEAFGILAGDALLNYAFETALTAFDLFFTEPGPVMWALQILARKAGIHGMIGGQTADIQAEGQKEPLTKAQLLYIHENKTAALIQASMMIGAVLAGAGYEEVEKIERCAYNIGIAFQIQDDILDVVGDEKELGKPIGSDEKNSKQTYVTINGLEASRREVETLSKEAIDILEELGCTNDFLKELIRKLIHRQK